MVSFLSHFWSDSRSNGNNIIILLYIHIYYHILYYIWYYKQIIELQLHILYGERW